MCIFALPIFLKKDERGGDAWKDRSISSLIQFKEEERIYG